MKGHACAEAAMGPLVRWLLVGAAVAAVTAAAAAGLEVIQPSTEEAAARGVVYVMMSYPQEQGLLGFGCGFADLDGDGDPDIILTGHPTGLVGIFENDGAGFFTDRSHDSGIPALSSASGFAAGDINGDGLPELYLTQMGFANVLMRNEGGFQFTNITGPAGVGDPGAGMAPNFGDFDGDGLLDLYVCNYNDAVPGTEFLDNRLYRNLGDETFEDVSIAQTVDDHGYGFQAVWFDFDLDDDLDLYLSNDRGHQPPLFRPNQLWRNDNGQMVNISAGSGADVGLFSMGVACGDFDGNGWADLYVTNIDSYAEGYNPLLLNQGNVSPPYVEASAVAGVDHWITSWGAIFYDFDNNGWQDLYVNNMFEPNSIYLGDGAFPCTADLGVDANIGANTGVSFGSAVADVDNDGDLDLLVNNLDNNVELFINHEGDARGWIKYRMVGLGGNVLAVGGKVSTQVGAQLLYREILAGGNGYLGQNELVVHVGLGTATTADQVVATWPGGAATRTLTDLPAGETWTLYPPQRLGDADASGTVELNDFLVLAACYGGGFQPGCEMMDFDGNSVIDLDDFDAFVAAYDGPLHDCNNNGTIDLQDMLLDPAVDLDGTGIPDFCEDKGDLDGDGSVGITDFLIVLGFWGPCPDPPAACPADIDDDGMVGITDFLFILGNWG